VDFAWYLETVPLWSFFWGEGERSILTLPLVPWLVTMWRWSWRRERRRRWWSWKERTCGVRGR
jgi:hypothetical protein